MPMYEFRCRECGHVFEEFVFSSSSSMDDLKCPQCGKHESEKLMSAFSSAASDSGSGYSAPASSCGSGGFS